jgi:hypothetical protein
LNHLLGILSNAVITLSSCGSLALLVAALPARKEAPTTLLVSAFLLWFVNILTSRCGTGDWMPEGRPCVENTLLTETGQIETTISKWTMVA